jgi:hypothetical protein
MCNERDGAIFKPQAIRVKPEIRQTGNCQSRANIESKDFTATALMIGFQF